MAARLRPIVAVVIVSCFVGYTNSAQYLGKFIGKLSELHHGVSGEVYAVDGRTLHIKDFTYDGEAPAAYYYAGSSGIPSKAGFKIKDENGGKLKRRYRKEGVTITLPDGKTLNDIRWFSIWCEEFEVNFGDVRIPPNFSYPRPQKLAALAGAHDISSDNVVIVDAQTLLIPNLSYDGEPPDGKFWVGRGDKPTPQGIRVPDENGKELPLRRYRRKTVVLTLPGDLTVFDIDYFGIWCEAFAVDFGHIRIPKNLNVPPSLKMLGISPQSKLNCEVLHDDLAFEVRWAVAGDSIVLQLVAKLGDREYMSFGVSGDPARSVMVGGDVVVSWVDRETLKGYAEDYFLDAKSQCSGPKGSCPDERLAPNTNSIKLLNAAMVNGYSIVTYQRSLKAADELDQQILTNGSQAIIWAIGPLNQRDEVSFHSKYTKGDRFIDFGRTAKWNCPMPEAESPTSKPVQVHQRGSARTVTTTTTTTEAPAPPSTSLAPSRSRGSERRRGSTARKETLKDSENSASQPSRARHQTERRGISRGSDRNSVSRETTTTTTTTTTARPIPTPAPVTDRNAWEIPPIQCYEPEDGVFYAQMGPTGGKRGYPAITGHVGWGIAWYINGLLIPEINVVRGKTYTFVVEGGLDPEVPAKYHPLYITDDPVGGYEYKTPEERRKVRIFAGAIQTKDGKVLPNGVGRLCHWTHQGDAEADDFESFGAYQRTLELKCDTGEPGVIQWTPDKDTPDTVYYQCFTHRYLGWKINVLDSCDTQGAASDPQPSIALPEDPFEAYTDMKEDLAGSASIIHETRVKPNDIGGTDKVTNKPEEVEDTPLKKPTDFPYEFQDPFEQANSTQIAKKQSNLETTIAPTRIVQKHRPGPGRFSFRRPIYSELPVLMQNKPHIPDDTVKTMLRPISSAPKQKKPMYRPIAKVPSVPRPVRMPSKRPQNLIPYEVPVRNPSKIKPQNIPVPKIPHIEHIEISPLQASTEKEPDLKQYAPLISVKPEEGEEVFKMQPAVNTGFKPESIVIEGGFKPIISRDIDHRTDEDGPELEYESEIGVIDVSNEKPPSEADDFGPVFIPSPLDKQAARKPLKINKRGNQKKNTLLLIIKKQARNVEDDDEMTAAAERVDSYYLPPPDKKLKSSDISSKPQDIDIPPGTVVTYDGKKVSGASLTAKLVDRGIILDGRASKAAELIKAGPQFAPFKGDLPPLDPKYVNTDVPQLQSRGLLSRELEGPLPDMRMLYGQHRVNSREKRAAHHTPEHTAEQMAEAARNDTKNASSILVPSLLLAAAQLARMF